MPVHPRAAIAPGGTTKKAVPGRDYRRMPFREDYRRRSTGDTNERKSRGIRLCRAITRWRRLCWRKVSAGATTAIEHTTQTLPRASGGRYVHLKPPSGEGMFGGRSVQSQDNRRCTALQVFSTDCAKPGLLAHLCFPGEWFNRSPRTSPFRTAVPPPRCGPRFRDPPTGLLRPDRPELIRPCSPGPGRSR